MTNIYFIRHGKTEWNLQHRFQGANGDSNLLPSSYREIKLLANSLAGIKFAKIYASPIKRARVTALELARHLNDHPRVSLLSRLKEFDLGKMEGMKYEEVAERYPISADNFHYHPEKYDAQEIGGEDYPQLLARMVPAIKTMVQNHPDENILVVSHGAALTALINHLLGVDIADLKKRGGLTNTSTTILNSTDNGETFNLIKWNDASYIDRQLDDTDTV